jgi:EAL domain-containing protein (putative c-di-GMP-specific phosphodiesterase class I)
LVASKIVGTLGLPHALDGHEVRSTPSVGIALFGAGAHALDDLLKQADMAMYEAKAAGRNDYRFFDPAMQAGIDKEAALESELRHALASHALTLFYQPVIDRRGAMRGVEALVRWRHPVRGIVGPAEFIPLAEKSELIVDIGTRVLTLACRQLAEWRHDERTRQLTVAVNISGRQARHPDFVDHVTRILAQTGAEPALLKLELTESMLLGCVNEMILKMKALSQLGVRFALDDFGTGYSSLSYLERLPIAQIKIDRSFVSDMLVTSNAATITRAIITLGRNLGLEIVAEGVESEEQRLALMESGCDRFQGYLFSAPIPADGIERWLFRTTLKTGVTC